MSKDVVAVNLNEAFGRFLGLGESAVVEKSHAEPVQGILKFWVNFKCLPVESDGLVEPVLSEGIHGFFK